MATTSFTTRMDPRLKADLEEIARLENRSASHIANRAIAALVEEHKATRALAELGLEMIGRGAPTLSSGAVHAWLLSEEDTPPFPAPGS